jgi:hypothetical protein
MASGLQIAEEVRPLWLWAKIKRVHREMMADIAKRSQSQASVAAQQLAGVIDITKSAIVHTPPQSNWSIVLKKLLRDGLIRSEENGAH